MHTADRRFNRMEVEIKRLGRRSMKVVTARGHVDYAIQYPNGQIAYDWPERVPQYVKRQVEKLFNGIIP